MKVFQICNERMLITPHSGDNFRHGCAVFCMLKAEQEKATSFPLLFRNYVKLIQIDDQNSWTWMRTYL